LNLIINANGAKRIVGDSIEITGDCDLVLITNENVKYSLLKDFSSCDIREISIQFSTDIFEKLLDDNQYNCIGKMIDRAEYGLCFPVEAILNTYRLIDTLSKEQKCFHSIMKLLTILYELSLYAETSRQLIKSTTIKDIYSPNNRIKKIQDPLQRPITKKI